MQVDRTRLYRVSTVAELLDLSLSTVYRAIESGALDALRFGTSLRVSGDALAAWLDQCGQSSYQTHVVAGVPADDAEGQVAGAGAVVGEVR